MMQTRFCMLTGAGSDRVGIVADISEFLCRFDCNLMDSSMTKLRGEFALLLMISLPADKFPLLKEELQAMGEKLGLTLALRELSAEELQEVISPECYLAIRVYGADHPGIVAAVTRELARHGLNVTDVQTKMIKQETEDIFVMLLEAEAPDKFVMEELLKSMKVVAERTGVTISAEEIEVMEL